MATLHNRVDFLGLQRILMDRKKITSKATSVSTITFDNCFGYIGTGDSLHQDQIR